MTEIYLTKAEVRQFILVKQGLLGNYRFTGKKGILDFIRQAGCIQFDPIVYGSLNDALCQDLCNCYENVLQCCLDNHIKSVASCCISTGEFHFPNEKTAEIACETVIDFLNPGFGHSVK